MIKRVTTEREARIVCNSFTKEAIEKSGAGLHYGGEPYNTERMFQAWGNTYLLTNECVMVANFDTPEHVDSLIWFIISEDFITGNKVAQSMIWISNSPKTGLKIFKEAEKIIKEKFNVDYILIGIVYSSSVAESFENVLCKKLDFIPEAKSFYKKV